MNNVSLIGRIANDLELKTTQTGRSVMSFDLAVPAWNKDEPPHYITIVCWGKTAEFANLYLGKGRQIGVTGSLSVRKYTDKDGNNRRAVEVIADKIDFADSKKEPETADVAPITPADPSGFEEVTDTDGLPFDVPNLPI